MNILINADGWADLMAAQMATAVKSLDISTWGYACLCIGWKFEDAITRRYEELDRLSGDFLHIFTLLPPPKHIVERELARLDSLLVEDLDDAVKHRLETLRNESKYLYQLNPYVGHEKVEILNQLQSSLGVNADHRTDFLFIRFGDERAIENAIAASSSLDVRPSDYEVADLFKDMGDKAKKHFLKGHEIEEYVGSLQLRWRSRAALQQVWALRNFIQGFLSKLI